MNVYKHIYHVDYFTLEKLLSSEDFSLSGQQQGNHLNTPPHSPSFGQQAQRNHNPRHSSLFSSTAELGATTFNPKHFPKKHPLYSVFMGRATPRLPLAVEIPSRLLAQLFLFYATFLAKDAPCLIPLITPLNRQEIQKSLLQAFQTRKFQMDVFQECALAALETLYARGFNRYCSVKYLENTLVSSRLLKRVTSRHKSVMKSLGQSLDLTSTGTTTVSIKEKQELWNGSVSSFSKILGDKKLLDELFVYAESRHEGENVSCLLFHQTRLLKQEKECDDGDGGDNGGDNGDLCLYVLYYLTFVDGRAAVPLNLGEKRKKEVRDAIEAFKKSDGAAVTTTTTNGDGDDIMAAVVESLRNVNRDVEMIVYTNTYREYCRSISS